MGCIFLLVFQRLTKGPSGAQDRIGITIQNTTALSFVGLLNAIAVFPAERNLYLHESRSSARYSPATFVIVYSVVEVGFEVVAALAYGALVCFLLSTLFFLLLFDWKIETRMGRGIIADNTDECSSRDANFRSNLFPILNLNLDPYQHG